MVDEDYSVTVRDVQVLRGNTAILRYPYYNWIFVLWLLPFCCIGQSDKKNDFFLTFRNVTRAIWRIFYVVSEKPRKQLCYSSHFLKVSSFAVRCEVPEHLRPYIRVTSWLHEEGTAIEIFPERDPRGKYTLLQSGDLLVHHTSTYDTYKKYVCKTEHTLSGIRRRSLIPARLTLKGNHIELHWKLAKRQ